MPVCLLHIVFALGTTAVGAQATPLPIIKITADEEIPDEPKVDGDIEIIWNGEGNLNRPTDPANEYSGRIGIEIRGQSSRSFPKKGYGFETRDADGSDIDTSFLGFPPEEDWVLHGPFSDKSLLRNVVAMHMARLMGDYASRTRAVELYLNDDYRGIYILMERIKRDDNRVDVARLREEDIAGEELTGGYIFKIDKGRPDWLSQYSAVNEPDEAIAFQHVYPRADAIQPEQAEYIQAYVDSFENALVAPDLTYRGKYFTEYMDVTSFVHQFLINEITQNVDAYRISTYYHKKKITNGGLLHAGPAWDFNLALGNANYCDGDSPEGYMYYRYCDEGNPFWWGKLLENEDFTTPLACRWEELRAGPLRTSELLSFINEQVDLLAPAVDRNFERWPVLGEFIWPNPSFPDTYEEEIANLKAFVVARMTWLDRNMIGTCTRVSTAAVAPDDVGLVVSPNPASEELFVTTTAGWSGAYRVELLTAVGGRVWSRAGRSAGGRLGVRVDLASAGLPGGFYVVLLFREGRLVGRRKVLVE